LKRQSAVTPEQIEEILAFLPLLDRPGRSFVEAWRGGEKTPGGAITTPYPAYHPDVEAFFRVAGRSCWSDPGYEPAAAAAMLRDDDAVRRATLDEVRTMLTCCVRGERFCDGYWEAVLSSGRVVALLKRLEVLRAGMLE
jgi:hypothetical protein